MTGAIWAMLSGVGFGFFQAFNRKARQGFSVYWATFILLVVSVLIMGTASVMMEDLTLLRLAPPSAFINLGLAGFIHFFLGWTLLTISQNRVGAARTGALVGVTPLFATVIAIIAFDEFLTLPVLAGVVIVVGGVYFVSVSGANSGSPSRFNWRDSIYGLSVALCFSISPIFIRAGQEELPSPLLAVTVGMGVSAIAYGVLLLFRRERLNLESVPNGLLLYQLMAGVMVGISTWMRWIALDLAPVAVVLALGRLNVPVVILLSLVLVGQKQERVTVRVWLGAGLIVLGSLMLIFF